MSRRRLIESVLWPALVVGNGCIFYWAFRNGWGEIALVVSGPIILGAITLLELLLPVDPEKQALGDPQLWNDVAHTLLGNATILTAGALLVYTTAIPLAGYLSETWGASLWPTHWATGAQVFLAMLATDGLEYWRHRLMHRIPWLWRLHSLHHSVDRLHAIKGGRVHLLDRFSTSVMIFAPLALTGIPQAILMWSAAPVIILSPLAHSNVRFRLPAFAHRLLVTPQEHRIHHARDLAQANRNYAAVFPFWDLLFGTFEAPGPVQPELGIDGDATPPGLWQQIVAPFAAAGASPPGSARADAAPSEPPTSRTGRARRLPAAWRPSR